MTKSLSLVALIILCAGSISAATVFAESNIFTIAEATLPVELSSFTAVQSATDCVTLTWITHSETGLLGYQVFRSDADNLSSAIRISAQLIPATNTSTTQVYSFADTEVEMNHNYYYWLESVDYYHSNFFGPNSVMVLGDGEDVTPPQPEMATGIYNIYPNPFNPDTIISYTLREESQVAITVINCRGQSIRTLVNDHKTVGLHQIGWDGRDNQGNSCSSGLYLLRFSSGNMNQTAKLMLVK